MDERIKQLTFACKIDKNDRITIPAKLRKLVNCRPEQEIYFVYNLIDGKIEVII